MIALARTQTQVPAPTDVTVEPPDLRGFDCLLEHKEVYRVEESCPQALAASVGRPDPVAGIQEKLADANNIKRGEALVRKWGCFGCHDIKGMEKESRIGAELTTFGSKTVEELGFGNRTDIKHSWDDWTYNKLKSPRGYATEQIGRAHV